MYGTKHLIILAVCLLYIIGVSLLLQKKQVPLKIAVRLLLGVGIISESLKVCSYIIKNEAEMGGYLPKTDLPFHLCSVQILFMILLVLSENEKLKRVLIAFMLPTCLVGGAAALLLPTSSSLNMPVVTVQYFLYHSSIIVFSLYLYRSPEVRFTFRDYISALLMLFGVFFAAIYINSALNDYQNNINFMYVVKPPMEGLPYLNNDKGWLVYILRYALLAVAAVSACYCRPILAKIRKKDA